MCLKISVIVPVYNTEKYLHRCIDSILAQTFADFELLLVNDGSTDSSGAICDEYAQKDNRVRVFHKENTGVSATRNLGIDNSKGEYLIFIDSDDYWIDNNSLEQLYLTAIQHDLDIVRGEYKAVDENGEDLFVRPISKSKEKVSYKVIDNETFLEDIINGEYFFVLCLVRKDILGDIKYNEKRSFLEDMEFISHLIMNPMRCMYVPIRFYAYRKISTSASNTPKLKNLEDSFGMCDVFHGLSLKTNVIKLKERYEYNSIMMYYWTLDTITLDSYFFRRSEIIKNYGLKELQKKVNKWSLKSSKKYPIIIKMSPIIGVCALKIKHIIGKLIRKIS